MELSQICTACSSIHVCVYVQRLFTFTFDLVPYFTNELIVTMVVSISPVPVYCYANRSAISYPRNNTLVVPPNYMELFMSIRVINRVSNDLYALCVYVCTFVICDSSFDHFTPFYANYCLVQIAAG